MGYKVEINEAGKKALARVAKWLEDGAPHVITDNLGRVLSSFNMEYGVDNTECGTACCIAGAVVQFEGLGNLNEDNSMPFFRSWGADGVEVEFNRLCGLPEDSSALAPLTLPWEYFDVIMTDEEEQDIDDFVISESSFFSDTKAAAATIRHLIATGEIDWSVGDPERFVSNNEE